MTPAQQIAAIDERMIAIIRALDSAIDLEERQRLHGDLDELKWSRRQLVSLWRVQRRKVKP